MVKNESSCLNFKLVNIFVILMFLICSSIFYGIYYVFSIVSNVNAMSVAFPALRAIVEQVPERLVVLDKNGNYNGQIVLDLSWDKEFTLISKKMLKDGQYIIAEIHRMPKCVLDLYEIIGHRRYNWIVHLKK